MLDQAERLGIETEFFIRPIDRLVWPHAKKGFFALRKRIPEILESLGITPPRQGELLPH
jgi:hypothetical protein